MKQKIFNHLYNFSVDPPENVKTEVNRIGNNAFMFMWLFNLIFNLIVTPRLDENPITVLYLYSFASLVVSLFGVGLYITIATYNNEIISEFRQSDQNQNAKTQSKNFLWMSFIRSILGFLVLNVYFSYTLPLVSLFNN
ncbi:DUF3278 domain-containing protein [Facklamia sp. DSM 111018]|uniref:DUF3278 domain-containing protein n=1 Tax=Facklamia lactis TaxID=2749967 RepID=A0ABS0LQ57_9LACT|nr:DUF3278 domain-containing protein [Facklamia lactis]MBG9980487.1 DUF3278 domain-containing protein [Facklamia lactis]MBG9986279.1 DUF3278 domain-containing protein [Facklamia lactis]